MSNDVLKRLRNGLLELDMDSSLSAAREIAATGGPNVVGAGVDESAAALQIVGKRFQEGEWFLSELVYAGEISKEVMRLLSPLMKAGARESAGTVIYQDLWTTRHHEHWTTPGMMKLYHA